MTQSITEVLRSSLSGIQMGSQPAMSGSVLPAGLMGDTQGPMESIPWTYWRRADGWLTIGQYNPTEFMRQLRKKYRPVDGYNEALTMFNLNDPKGPMQFNNYERGGKFGPLLQAGGAGEFPVEQVIELGWYEKPPKVVNPMNGQMVAVDFPQLDAVREKVVTVECQACGWRHSSLDDVRARRNLKKHEAVIHKDTSGQQELGRILAEATVGKQQLTNEQITGALLMLAESNSRMQQLMERIVGQVPAAAVPEQVVVVPEPEETPVDREELIERALRKNKKDAN